MRESGFNKFPIITAIFAYFAFAESTFFEKQLQRLIQVEHQRPSALAWTERKRALTVPKNTGR